MAHTDLDVVNIACAKIGADRLEAIDEDTPVGAFATDSYYAKRAYCLGRYRWTFAQVVVPLQPTELPPDAPYPNCYLEPIDAIGPIYAFRRTPQPVPATAEKIIPLQVDGKIFTFVAPPLYAEYPRQVPEHLWPATFVEFIATAWAADLAAFLQRAQDRDRFDALAWGPQNLFPNRDGGLFLTAMTEDSRNAPQRVLEQVHGGPLVGVRPVSGGFYGFAGFDLCDGLDFVPPPGEG